MEKTKANKRGSNLQSEDANKKKKKKSQLTRQHTNGRSYERYGRDKWTNSSTFTTNTTGQLNILGHDGDTLGVNSAQVGIFEQTDQIGFCGLLQGKNGRALETKVRLEVLCDFTNQTLERKLTDEQVGTLLELADFTKSDSSCSFVSADEYVS